MDKNQLRKELLEKRKNLDEKDSYQASLAIVNNVLNFIELSSMKAVFSYMPYGKEANIMALNQWILDNDKVLCIPRVTSPYEMDAVSIKNLNTGLISKTFDILEPATDLKAFNIEKIDLVLVPGVAFDKSGNRLGHGNGYYDRFLARCHEHTKFVGICYAFQLLDYIPSDSFDIKVHTIITEEGRYV